MVSLWAVSRFNICTSVQSDDTPLIPLRPTSPFRIPAPEDLRDGNAGIPCRRNPCRALQEKEVGTRQHSIEGIQIQKILSLQSVPLLQPLKIPGTVAYQGSQRVSFLPTQEGIPISTTEDRSAIVHGTGLVYQQRALVPTDCLSLSLKPTHQGRRKGLQTLGDVMGLYRPEAQELVTAVAAPLSTKDLVPIPFADLDQEMVHPSDQCQVSFVALVHRHDVAEISDLVKEAPPRESQPSQFRFV